MDRYMNELPVFDAGAVTGVESWMTFGKYSLLTFILYIPLR
jgi:hypothetical protein